MRPDGPESLVVGLREALQRYRDNEEIRIMVRLPKEDRRSLHTLSRLKVRAPSGAEVPLNTVADFGGKSESISGIHIRANPSSPEKPALRFEIRQKLLIPRNINWLATFFFSAIRKIPRELGLFP